ncbi:hypothetical protein LY76DRAFT_25517 [Colletotrichum caudatum]|nr:hypothetical protein LY76DRAFT_25517 [Colletotrichum caudatum]
MGRLLSRLCETNIIFRVGVLKVNRGRRYQNVIHSSGRCPGPSPFTSSHMHHAWDYLRLLCWLSVGRHVGDFFCALTPVCSSPKTQEVIVVSMPCRKMTVPPFCRGTTVLLGPLGFDCHVLVVGAPAVVPALVTHFCTPRRPEEATVPTSKSTPSTHIELGLPTAKEDTSKESAMNSGFWEQPMSISMEPLAGHRENILPCSPSRTYAVSRQGWINGKYPCRKPLAPETRRLERAGRPEKDNPLVITLELSLCDDIKAG